MAYCGICGTLVIPRRRANPLFCSRKCARENFLRSKPLCLCGCGLHVLSVTGFRYTHEVKRKRKTDNDFFVVDLTGEVSLQSVKQRYVRKRRKQNTYRCDNEICSIVDTWNGQSISLQVDHINGYRYDHRLQNLRLLCPNCHAQTDTFGGKNRGKYSNVS